MLISKKDVSPGDIVGMKLITGDEIICKLVNCGPNSYTVTKPIGIAMAGNGQLAMIPFMFSLGDNDKSELEIIKNNVVAITVAREELSSAYIQNTTSIQPASASDLAGLQSQMKGAKVGGTGGSFKL